MTTPALDPNLAMVMMGIIGIIVPMATLLVNFVQNRSIAKDARRDLVANTSAAAVAVQDVAVQVEQARQDSAVTRAAVAVEVAAVAEKVEEARLNVAAHVDQKLDAIQNTLVNGPLTQALETIEELKGLLQTLAPNDRRVQELVTRP